MCVIASPVFGWRANTTGDRNPTGESERGHSCTHIVVCTPESVTHDPVATLRLLQVHRADRDRVHPGDLVGPVLHGRGELGVEREPAQRGDVAGRQPAAHRDLRGGERVGEVAGLDLRERDDRVLAAAERLQLRAEGDEVEGEDEVVAVRDLEPFRPVHHVLVVVGDGRVGVEGAEAADGVVVFAGGADRGRQGAFLQRHPFDAGPLRERAEDPVELLGEVEPFRQVVHQKPLHLELGDHRHRPVVRVVDARRRGSPPTAGSTPACQAGSGCRPVGVALDGRCGWSRRRRGGPASSATAPPSAGWRRRGCWSAR